MTTIMEAPSDLSVNPAATTLVRERFIRVTGSPVTGKFEFRSPTTTVGTSSRRTARGDQLPGLVLADRTLRICLPVAAVVAGLIVECL